MSIIKIETIAIIRSADDSKALANRLGAGAVIALAEDIFPQEGGKIAHGYTAEITASLENNGLPTARAKDYSKKFPANVGKIPHGYAAEIAALLKDGGIGAARAKYYSEKSVQVIKAVLHTCLVQRAKGKTLAEKAEIFDAAKASAFAELASLSSVPAIQAWVKKQLPAKAVATTPTTTTTPTITPSEAMIDAAVLSKAVAIFDLLAIFAAGIHASQSASVATAKASRKAPLKKAA